METHFGGASLLQREDILEEKVIQPVPPKHVSSPKRKSGGVRFSLPHDARAAGSHPTLAIPFLLLGRNPVLRLCLGCAVTRTVTRMITRVVTGLVTS